MIASFCIFIKPIILLQSCFCHMNITIKLCCPLLRVRLKDALKLKITKNLFSVDHKISFFSFFISFEIKKKIHQLRLNTRPYTFVIQESVAYK